MFLEVKEDKQLQVAIERCDQCFTCLYHKICPLLSALQNEVAILKYQFISINECEMKNIHNYKRYNVSLKNKDNSHD